MGYLLFQVTLFAYVLATAAYMVYFWSQRKEIRTSARAILISGGVLHTVYLIVRYFQNFARLHTATARRITH